MKAVIVEIDNNKAVALNKNGEFVRLKNDGSLKVGYEVELPQARIFNINAFIRAASIAAVFLLVTGVTYGAYSYTMPYSYIDVDINPSIELTTNRYDRIIDAEALNDDGKKLLESGYYKNRNIKDGIQNILKSAVEKGYLKTDSTDAVVVTVSGKDDIKVGKIEQQVEEAAKQNLGVADVGDKVLIEKTTLQNRTEAGKLGLSPGKLSLIERLIEVNPDLKLDDLKSEPVREIMKQIKEGRKTAEQKNAQDKSGKVSASDENETAASTDDNNNRNVAGPEKQKPDKNSKTKQMNGNHDNNASNKNEDNKEINKYEKGDNDKKGETGKVKEVDKVQEDKQDEDITTGSEDTKTQDDDVTKGKNKEKDKEKKNKKDKEDGD